MKYEDDEPNEGEVTIVRRVCPECCRMQDFEVRRIVQELARHTISRKEETCTVCGGTRISNDPFNDYKLK